MPWQRLLRWIRAIEGYTKVIELRPQWHNARYNRGLAYLTLILAHRRCNEFGQCHRRFLATLEVRRSYVEAYINLAIAYYTNGAGDMDASIDDLSDALRYNPKAYCLLQPRIDLYPS